MLCAWSSQYPRVPQVALFYLGFWYEGGEARDTASSCRGSSGCLHFSTFNCRSKIPTFSGAQIPIRSELLTSVGTFSFPFPNSYFPLAVGAPSLRFCKGGVFLFPLFQFPFSSWAHKHPIRRRRHGCRIRGWRDAYCGTPAEPGLRPFYRGVPDDVSGSNRGMLLLPAEVLQALLLFNLQLSTVNLRGVACPRYLCAACT
jgi:hypothetical protein